MYYYDFQTPGEIIGRNIVRHEYVVLITFQKGLVSVLLSRKMVKEMRLYDLLGVQPGVLLKQILSYFESICPVSQYAVND